MKILFIPAVYEGGVKLTKELISQLPNSLVLAMPVQFLPFKEQIKKQLKDKIADFEIALNFSSGTGKEHMAILEAVLQLGLNFRLITVNRNNVEVLGLKS